ncbi:MAG: hypothetical protein JWN72_401 [Thermoleophilia bacterium]|nr:hypothetical protein [Thermoleophilia bacterium]
MRHVLPLACAVLAALPLAFAGSAAAATPFVDLGTASADAVAGGSTITNTGNSVLNGDLALFPGTAVVGFPPGLVNGATHVNDAVAQQAKSDLTTAYLDAAGRPLTATIPPDAGNQTLVSGVYRTGSVPTLGLTGTLTLDAQGDPRAVFIFQVQSALTTATDSRVALINGAQSCNVFWQVGSSATIGTRTSFAGNVLALTSISVNDAATIDGRLLARNGAVTLINDTVTRGQCAAGTEQVIGGGGGTGPTGGTGGGTTVRLPGPDVRGPITQIFGTPPTLVGPPRRAGCTDRDFTARIVVRDGAGISKVHVLLDGRRIRTSTTGLSLVIRIHGLAIGSHRLSVVAYDRAGNRSVVTRAFARCRLAIAAPRFTG